MSKNMSKNVLRKKFNNMYGKDKSLNSDTSINNIIKNITPNNIDYNTNSYEQNYNHNNSLHIEQLSTSSNNMLSNFIFIILLFFIISILYFFKDIIYKKLLEIWNNIFNGNSKLNDNINNLIKNENDIKKEEENKKKKEEEELKKEKSQIEEQKDLEKKKELEKQSGLNELNNKVNELSKTYNKNQIATSNGFCYIGYDLGQRECTDIYSGEICMSGQIFPTMDVCINPNFRP